MPRITIEVDSALKEIEVLLRCPKKDALVEKLVSHIELLNQTMIVQKDQKQVILPLADILYFESVDEKTYCYVAKAVYETQLRLYEIENALGRYRFVRCYKSIIVNLNQIRSFKSTINGRMEAMLANGERIEISRNYVAAIKTMLGGIRS
jgi:DNA-binding LytR/AlgR family response regulator